MITGVTKVLTKDVKEVNHAVKSFSVFPYMLKPYYVLTQQFKENKKAQDKLFNHICDVESRSVWGGGRRTISSYLDIDVRKYQYCLFNIAPLDDITGYIMKDSVGDSCFNRLPQRRLNLFDRSI